MLLFLKPMQAVKFCASCPCGLLKLMLMLPPSAVFMSASTPARMFASSGSTNPVVFQVIGGTLVVYTLEPHSKVGRRVERRDDGQPAELSVGGVELQARHSAASNERDRERLLLY